ncbi:hypothetical protein C882_2751 [Caenispirillum salinarum AK4]|uniref:Transmembrane protein n=1 Tax=Caenispirillum salinarum AK4 TaxID=1238182 RepID=K9GNZ8_9PROT|nr:hypothetical protein [Caenispirillum salinarum]EKV26459.1 hypothetical protein C882_2751 [Caenispirillum salinarum AK4]
MPQTLPPAPEPDLGPPAWLKSLVIGLLVASFELTAELMILGPAATPWLSLTLLCAVGLLAHTVFSVLDHKRRGAWSERRDGAGQAAESR